MSRKQLISLFIAYTIPTLIGNSLLPLLPVYTSTLGGDTSMTGLYLGLAFGVLAVGTLISGWLTDHFQQRKIFITLAGAINIPALFLMGHVTALWQLTLLTMIVWFVGGISMAAVQILAGMCAPAAERGRIFGILATTLGVSQLAGGLFSGRIVDQWGFPALFALLAVAQLALIAAGVLLKDEPGSRSQESQQARSQPMGRAVWLVLIASMLASTLVFSSNLGLTVSMSSLGFDATAISSSLAIAGFITLPLPFVIGWLSDRFDRARLLALVYGAAFTAAVILAQSSELWHFWVVQILMAATGGSLSVGSALIADLAHPRNLSVAMSRFVATRWLGGVIGFAGSGFVMQAVGFELTYLSTALLALVAILLQLAIGHEPHQRAAHTA